MDSKKQDLKIGLIQSQALLEPKKNLEKTLIKIRQCAEEGAQIVCTQELFCTRYFCQIEDPSNFNLAETIPGHSLDVLQAIASELGVVIVASLFEKRMKGLYHNTAAVIDADGSLLGLYRKMHIPEDPDYYEKYYFTPGDLGYPVWTTRYGKIAVLICWDQWFPEAARLVALQGAEILFYPTAIGWQDEDYEKEGEDQYQSWQLIQRAHAIANGIYVCAVNRVGQEDRINFWGQSFICNPSGKVLCSASSTEEENIIHTVDLSQVEYFRRKWPFLRDRRVDSYKNIFRLGFMEVI